MKTFKLLGLLLTYPVSETLAHWTKIGELLANEKLLPKKQLERLNSFIDEKLAQDIYGAQEDYVETFDRGRGHCLHLFEHVHGESRERGPAMVDLTEMYASKGLLINQAELPDYLPLFLEYCSSCEYAEAKSLLGEVATILASIGAKLKKRNNAYHIIFDALQVLAAVKVSQKVIDAAVAAVLEEDNSLEALDKEWEESAAFGGDPQQEDCHSCHPNAADKEAQTASQILFKEQEQVHVIKVKGGVQ
jgi:nitrate reductase delta subunit